MARGLLITPRKQFRRFHYKFHDCVEPISLHKYCVSKGIGDISLLETIIINKKKSYFVYGWIDGYTINQFDLNYVTAFNDIVIICFEKRLVIDVNIDEFIGGLRSISINLTDMDTDESMSEIDEYDFNDGFLVPG